MSGWFVGTSDLIVIGLVFVYQWKSAHWLNSRNNLKWTLEQKIAIIDNDDCIRLGLVMPLLHKLQRKRNNFLWTPDIFVFNNFRCLDWQIQSSCTINRRKYGIFFAFKIVIQSIFFEFVQWWCIWNAKYSYLPIPIINIRWQQKLQSLPIRSHLHWCQQIHNILLLVIIIWRTTRKYRKTNCSGGQCKNIRKKQHGSVSVSKRPVFTSFFFISQFF